MGGMKSPCYKSGGDATPPSPTGATPLAACTCHYANNNCITVTIHSQLCTHYQYVVGNLTQTYESAKLLKYIVMTLGAINCKCGLVCICLFFLPPCQEEVLFYSVSQKGTSAGGGCRLGEIQEAAD